MPVAIPSLVALTLGAIGAVAAVRWLAQEARRINAELHAQRDSLKSAPERVTPLARDPATGVYRPE